MIPLLLLTFQTSTTLVFNDSDDREMIFLMRYLQLNDLNIASGRFRGRSVELYATGNHITEIFLTIKREFGIDFSKKTHEGKYETTFVNHRFSIPIKYKYAPLKWLDKKSLLREAIQNLTFQHRLLRSDNIKAIEFTYRPWISSDLKLGDCIEGVIELDRVNKPVNLHFSWSNGKD